jgi:CheY-like chemotaxis protein
MADTSTTAIAVLIAEDETLVRMLATEMLEDEGYQVYEARDGREALTILERRGDSVRALISDITMPNLGGLDLAAIVSARWPHIGIVLMSANPPDGLQARLPKGSRFLAKPYTQREMLEALQHVWREKPAPGPAAALHSTPTWHAGQMHGAGGLAQPLPEPDE